MWLLHMEQTDGVVIKHARNGRQYRLPELPHFSVDGYCAESNTVCELCGCYWHGCACQPFRDVITTNGDTFAARYEQTMSPLEQITRAGNQVKIQWECEFDDAGIDTRTARPPNSVSDSPVYPGRSTGNEPRPCVYTTRREKARLSRMWM